MQLGVVLAVLGAAVSAAVTYEPPPPPPRMIPGAVNLPGIAAGARLVEQSELVARLALEVRVAGDATGRGDTGGPAEPEQLQLLDVAARGFQLRLVGRSTPLVLGPTGRFGSGLPYEVPLTADTVVVDCSVEVGAPRRITLAVRRGGGPTGRIPVETGPEVVRALDDLVRRTCRRPRG